jgi:hypothetical protein
MHAPTSAFLAEIFIQRLQHTHIINILTKHHTVDYYHYWDDILLVWDTHDTNTKDTLTQYNPVHLTTKFTQKKHRKKSNYLHINISNQHI